MPSFVTLVICSLSRCNEIVKLGLGKYKKLRRLFAFDWQVNEHPRLF